MKIIFSGLGSIGRRHAKILLDNFDHELYAFRHDKNSLKNDLNIPELSTWEAVNELRPNVALITNPTFLHIKTAIQCAHLGMHLFIEKPLSNTLENIDLLSSICREKQLTCYTAYGLRFHPMIQAIARYIADKKNYHARISCSSYLPHWRDGTDSKNIYSASGEKGGGVLLDLSHEFDYIQYLLGTITHMSGEYGRLSEVTINAEDYADIFLKTTKNISVNLHLNFLSLFNERRIALDYENGYLIGDLLQGKLEIFSDGQLKVEWFSTHRDDYLKAQIEYFLKHLSDGFIMNNLQESQQLLRKILNFKSTQKEKMLVS